MEGVRDALTSVYGDNPLPSTAKSDISRMDNQKQVETPQYVGSLANELFPENRAHALISAHPFDTIRVIPTTRLACLTYDKQLAARSVVTIGRVSLPDW